MTTDPATTACPDHQALVSAALDEAADDATLERYAAEVPSCPACQRSLAGRLSVHPALLDRARLDGVSELAAVMGAAGLEPPAAPVARRRAGWALVLAGVGTLAAAAVWWLTTATPITVPPPAPQAERPLPVAVPTPLVRAPTPPPTLPDPKTEVVPRPVVVAPRPQTPVEDDAVAEVDPVGEADWPPPPYEDLAGGTAKGAGALRAVQLVVSGTPKVGGTVSVATVASSTTELQVCVEGPERGVVWRGRVPGGRTALTRGGRPASFAFAAPGVYRFVAGTDVGVADCAPPVHVVEVEVSP